MQYSGKKYLMWIGALLIIAIFALVAANRTRIQKGYLVEGLTSSDGKNGTAPGQPQLYLMPLENHKRALNLSEGLFAASSPNLFHDGSKVVFQAKVNEEGPWQIYEYDFNQRRYSEVFKHESDCLDPVFLPTGEILFSSLVEVVPESEDLAFFVVKANKKVERITFTPYSYTQPLILQDGRILAMSSDGPGDMAVTLMVMRPDGTKNTLFYRSPDGNHILGDLRQLENGKVAFLELNKSKNRTELVAVNYNRPLRSREVLYSLDTKNQYSLGAAGTGKLLLSRLDKGEQEQLLELDLESLSLDPVSVRKDMELLGYAIYLRPVPRPKKLPSAVKPEVETALLMCQDLRVMGESKGAEMASAGSTVEVQGVTSSMGLVDPEADGSFYLKLKADTPFRFQQLDQKGLPVGRPSAWISLRPNERRACIGCHVSNERVPENVQPMAVQKEPLDLSVEEKRIMANSLD